MKKYILILQFFLFSYSFAQCTFENFFSYYPKEKSTMIALKDGGYLIYGTAWVDTIEWSEMNLILIKTDSCGNTIWVNNEGYLGAGDPSIYAIEMDNGNIMVVGYTAAGYTARIAKYNKNGELVKEKLLKENTDGFVKGLLKNPYSNSYIVYGCTENIASGSSKPLINEIDEDLNIIRRKEFQYNEITASSNLMMGKVSHLFHGNNNQYYGQISVGTNEVGKEYLVELDSTFSIKKSIFIPMDTLFRFFLYNMQLAKDQSHFDCSGLLKEKENDLSKQFILRIDLNGNINKINYLNETMFDITSMSPTLDGGYIFGPQLLKTDSNLNIQWMKPTRGKIYNVEQLSDGSYICGGVSMTRTILWGLELANEIYLVKMDQNGNYIKTGINEKNRQLSNDIVVYPNPSNNGIFSIKTTHQPYQTISIYNTNGQLVYTSTNAAAMVDLSSQANGLYYISIQNENGNNVYHQKIMVQQ